MKYIESRIEQIVTNGLGYEIITHYDNTEAGLIRHLLAMQMRLYQRMTGLSIDIDRGFAVSRRAQQYRFLVDQLKDEFSRLESAYNSGKIDRVLGREVGSIMLDKAVELCRTIFDYMNNTDVDESAFLSELLDPISSIKIGLVTRFNL